MSSGPYLSKLHHLGADLPGAACAQPVHLASWLLRKAAAAEEDSDKWEGYWWDVDSPDRRYALRVCDECPVRLECLRNRPPGHHGIWGGKVYQPTWPVTWRSRR